jgi:hypothetical protein
MIESATEREELLELERAGWSALCDGTASEFYRTRMTADGLMILANGAVLTRLEVSDSLADAPPWDGYSIDDPTTVALGQDATALVYTAAAHRGDFRFAGVMTSVYVRSGDGWKLALYQQTASG